MPRDGPPRHTGRIPPFRLVLRAETSRIEHLFKARHRCIMKQPRPIPDATQRGNLIETGSLTCLESQSWIGLNGYRRYIVVVGMIRRWLPSLRESQLSARIVRWYVTVDATLS